SSSTSPPSAVSERLWRPAAQQHPRFLKRYVGAERQKCPRQTLSYPGMSPRSCGHDGHLELSTQPTPKRLGRVDDETGAVQDKHSATSS
ncbi:hypothetical protein LY76DRAFT_525375, partial [Colletotrichum caudatum]